MPSAANFDSSKSLILRKHPSSLIGPFLRAFVPAVIGIIVLFHADSKVVSWIGLFLVFVAISYALYQFIIWYYDIVVINKERVIDITQKSLFSREIKEAPINKISNMVIKTSGLLSTFFGYGSVVISSSVGELILEDLKNPVEVKNIIEGLQKKGSLTANELIEYIVKAKQELD